MQVADELGYLISIQRTIQTNSTRILTPAVKVEPKIEEPSKIVESLETKYPYKSPRKKPTSAVLTVKTEAMSCLGITAQLDSTEQLGTMTILYFSALSTKIQS